MKNRTQIIPIVLLLTLTIVVGYSIIYFNYHVNSHGTVKAIGVEVYWDENLTLPVTDIDWGLVEPSTNETVIVYVYSPGNANTTLMLYAGEWNPAGVDSYMSCGWNRDGTVLTPHEYVEAEITLYVEQGIIEQGYDDFSFEIVLEGSG